MGKIHDVQKLTDNRFVNLYHVDATSVHNTPVSYYVASRAKDIPSLKMKTGRNDPDGVIIYSVYGEKKDKVVLIRQYRYALGGYIYEFPAGLVEPNEDFHEGAVREMHEETGLKLEPLKVDPAYEKPYFTTIGMTVQPFMAMPVARSARQPRRTLRRLKSSSQTATRSEGSSRKKMLPSCVPTC